MSILYGIKFENDFERLKLGYEQGLVAVKELTEEQFNMLLSNSILKYRINKFLHL